MTTHTVRCVVDVTYEDTVFTGPVFRNKPQATKIIDLKTAIKNSPLQEDYPLVSIELVKEFSKPMQEGEAQPVEDEGPAVKVKPKIGDKVFWNDYWNKGKEGVTLSGIVTKLGGGCVWTDHHHDVGDHLDLKHITKVEPA